MTKWKPAICDAGGMLAEHYTPGAVEPAKYRVSYEGGGNWHAYYYHPSAERPTHLGSEASQAGAIARCEVHAHGGTR
jgi:hypothetical protein